MYPCAWCFQEFNEGAVNKEGICTDGRAHRIAHSGPRRQFSTPVIESDFESPIEMFDEDGDLIESAVSSKKPKRTIRELNEQLQQPERKSTSDIEIQKIRRKYKRSDELGVVPIMDLVRQRIERQNAAKARKQERLALAAQQLGVTKEEQDQFIEAVTQ